MTPNFSASLFSNLKLSWQATGLFALTTLIGIASAFPGIDIAPATLLFLATALAIVIAGFVQAIDVLTRVMLPTQVATKSYVFIIQIIAIGIFRGFAFFFAVELAGVEQPTPLAVRLLTSVINTAIWLTFSCALIEATVHYSKQFKNLFRALSVAIAEKPQFKVTKDLDSLDNLVALKKNLSGILFQASEKGITTDALLAAGVAVREQIEQLIKPLSHRLWFNERRNSPQIRMFGLVKDSISSFTFLTPRFLTIWSALAFASILNAYSLERVIFGVAVSLAFFSISILLYRAIPAATIVKMGAKLSVPFILFMALVPVSVADLLMPLFGLERMLFPVSAATVVAPIAIIVLLIVESCIALVEQDRRMLNLHFESQLEGSDAFTPSAFASYLHNSLQSELTGIAYRLEASAANPNSAESRETLEKLGALINRSIGEDFANFEEVPLLRLERMIQAWDGIAAVTVSIEDACKENAAHLNLLVQVIEEATTNSVRYGKAKNIHADITKTAEGSKIVITTDAGERLGPSGGLGTQWLNELAIRQSPIEFTSSGTRLVVEI